MNLPAFLWLILLPLLASPLIYLVGRIFRQPRFWRVPNLIALLALLALPGSRLSMRPLRWQMVGP